MSDLYYYRARYYDPNAQCFLSSDPIEFEAGDFNFYRYVGNDPVNFVDPLGLYECKFTWPFKFPYKCTPASKRPKNKYICKKVNENCEEYARKIYDTCMQTYPSPAKTTPCSMLYLDMLKACKIGSNKIPICKEDSCK